jgi:hypothetical protein
MKLLNFLTMIVPNQITEKLLEAPYFFDSFMSFSSIESFLLPGLSIFFIVVIVYSVKKRGKLEQQRIETKYFTTVEKYYQIITNDPELNAVKSRIKRTHTIGWCLIIVGLVTALFLNIIGLIISFAGLIVMSSKNGMYEKIYKSRIMKAALYEYDKDLEYYPEGCIPRPQYDMANFENYDRYHSEDRINGKIAGMDFIMADVHVEDRRENRDGDTYYVTLFNGPVAILELPTTTKFEISIVNNKFRPFENKTKVEIDNPEFEDIYDVYCTDQIAAMKFLTPSITTKFIDMFNKYGFHFELKVFDTYMYFRFHSGNLFVPNPKDARFEAVGVARYFEILEGIKEIMNEVIETMKKV